jgi:hypothetical protein
MLQRRAEDELADLDRQRTEGREAFAVGVDQAEQDGLRDEAGTLITSHPALPFAGPEYEAEGTALQGQLASSGALRRQQEAKDLALLSGDPVLLEYAQAQRPDNTAASIGFRQQQLQQGQQRIDLARSEAERKARALEKTLGLREQQAKSAREMADRKTAEKKVADALKLEEGLRKEVMGNPVTKDYLDAQVAFDKVQRASQDPSAAGDLALIFGVMKTLDPGSTVREGEFANAQNAGGVDDRFVSAYNRVLRGERLSPEQRNDFVRTAQGQFQAHQGAFEQLVGGYRGVTERAGANFSNVLPIAARAPAAAPQVTPMPSGGAQPTASAGAAPAVTPETAAAALDWVRKNQNDARAPAVLKRLKELGVTP